MSKIKHEAFAYEWSNGEHKYVGYHIGSESDRYVSSSKIMNELYEENPDDWTRTILAWGTAAEMRAFETGWLRAVRARESESYLNRWENELDYTRDGNAEGHDRDFIEGVLQRAEEMQGSNGRTYYTVFIDDNRIHCNPEWVSTKDRARIERQLGMRVGCTVTFRRNYFWFSPQNLNEVI